MEIFLWFKCPLPGLIEMNRDRPVLWTSLHLRRLIFKNSLVIGSLQGPFCFWSSWSFSVSYYSLSPPFCLTTAFTWAFPSVHNQITHGKSFLKAWLTLVFTCTYKCVIRLWWLWRNNSVNSVTEFLQSLKSLELLFLVCIVLPKMQTRLLWRWGVGAQSGHCGCSAPE